MFGQKSCRFSKFCQALIHHGYGRNLVGLGLSPSPILFVVLGIYNFGLQVQWEGRQRLRRQQRVPAKKIHLNSDGGDGKEGQKPSTQKWVDTYYP